jgi:hypothetical protein
MGVLALFHSRRVPFSIAPWLLRDKIGWAWGCAMATIHYLFGTLALDPEEIEKLSIAYEGARTALQLSDRSERITAIIAERIIEAAKHGERDPAHLCAMAIKDLRVP